VYKILIPPQPSPREGVKLGLKKIIGTENVKI